MNETMTVDEKSLTEEQKPVADIARLVAALSPELPFIRMKRGEILKFSSSQYQSCYLLHRGSVVIRRRGDGMIIASEKAPFVFGLGNQPGMRDTMYLYCQEECDMSMIPLERVSEIILQQDLWKPLVQVLIYSMAKIVEHCTQVHQMSAYDIIRYQLYELLNEPDAVRLNTTVAKYIKGRTFLSRSGIMRILSELKTGKYIKIEHGILMGITYLPKKY